MSLNPPVVLDTNVFVAAGFRPGSGAAEAVRAVREGRVRMPWSDATRAEIEAVISRIPPLSRDVLEGLFRPEERVCAAPAEEGLEWVGDPADRKFAALARDTGSALVTNDRHLLERRHEAGFEVVRSGEWVARGG